VANCVGVLGDGKTPELWRLNLSLGKRLQGSQSIFASLVYLLL
jgi:hypothetical protein